MAYRTNLVGIEPPTPTDDTNKGYGVGSRWIDKVHDRKYTCTDATNRAAIWIEDYADVTDSVSVAAAGAIVSPSNMAADSAPTATDDAHSAYAIGSRWFDAEDDKEYVCLDATLGAAVWIETTATGGSGSGLWQSLASTSKLITAEDIDVQQKELIAAAIETLTATERGALSPVAAQLCYDTDDNHLYINV